MGQISDSELNGMLAVVQHGYDPKVALSLIKHLHACIKDGIDKDEYRFTRRVLLDYLEHAFEQIVENKASADAGFGLKRQRGKYNRADVTARNIQAASLVILGMRRGRTYLEAVGDAANQLFEDGKGERAVQDAYSNHLTSLESCSDEFLNDLLVEPE